MKHFFRFPLRVLAEFETPRERLERIVQFCIMDAGRKVVEQQGGNGNDLRAIWQCGCELLAVQSEGTNAPRAFQAAHRAVMEACGGDDQAMVTVATPFFWNCLYTLRGEKPDKPLSYREFSVLCAVLSKVGRKGFASCSWREVQRRALGYLTEKEMCENLPSRSDKAAPLSRQQIRTVLESLHRCGFFARYAVGNGQRSFLSYYSVRMNPQQLAEAATSDYCSRRREVVRMKPTARAAQAVLWRRFRQP